MGLKELEKHNPDFIVMVCNTIHIFHDYLSRQIDTKILELRSEVEFELKRRNIKQIFVIGTKKTLKTGLYNFDSVKYLMPNEEESNQLSQAILNFNKGFRRQEQINTTKRICKKYLNLGAESVLLGCTEFAVMLSEENIPKINTINVLVDATLRSFIKLRGLF